MGPVDRCPWTVPPGTAADRRWPVDNSTFCYAVAVHQVTASDVGVRNAARSADSRDLAPAGNRGAHDPHVPGQRAYRKPRRTPPNASASCWPRHGAGAPWRAELGLPEPSPRLADAIESLGRVVRRVAAPGGTSLFDALLTAADEDHPDETALDGLVRHVLALDARGTTNQAIEPSECHPLTPRTGFNSAAGLVVGQRGISHVDRKQET